MLCKIVKKSKTWQKVKLYNYIYIFFATKSAVFYVAKATVVFSRVEIYFRSNTQL